MTTPPAEELVLATITGDVDTVAVLLATNPNLANQRIPGNDRSMLHYATDWPGHFPNIAAIIGLLVAAGADPDVAGSTAPPSSFSTGAPPTGCPERPRWATPTWSPGSSTTTAT